METKNFLQELSANFKKSNTLPVLYGLLQAEPLNCNPEKNQILLEAANNFYKSNKSTCEKFYKPISKIY